MNAADFHEVANKAYDLEGKLSEALDTLLDDSISWQRKNALVCGSSAQIALHEREAENLIKSLEDTTGYLCNYTDAESEEHRNNLSDAKSGLQRALEEFQKQKKFYV